MTTNDRSLKLISIFLLGAMLFNFPLVSLFSREGLFLGLPKLYWYFFVVWGSIIALTAWVARPGVLRIGDSLRLHIPDQPVWPHLDSARS